MSEMINMAPPWPGMTREELTRAVAAGGRPTILAEHAASAPKGWSELMHQCWDQDPAVRPEFLAIHRKLNQIRIDMDSEGAGSESATPLTAKPNTSTHSPDSETEMITHSGNGKLVLELRSVAEHGSARTHITSV